MMSKKPKPKTTSSRSSSRFLTYALVIVLAVLVGYYVVLPAFIPRSPAVQTSTTGTGSYSVSLTPSTDIAGTMVTISGHKLPAESNVAVTFDSASVQLTNSSGATGCRTSSSGSLGGCNFWVPSTAASGPHTVTVSFETGTGDAVARFNVPKYAPPVSTVLVTMTSVALGLITQVVTRRVVDLDKERRMRAELNAFNKEKRDATVADDKPKLEKLKKRELAMRQEQAKVSMARFKVTGITFIPLLAVYYLMANFLGGYGVIVAFSPVPIPVITAPTLNPAVFEMSLLWWYFLSSFAFSFALTRIFHTNP